MKLSAVEIRKLKGVRPLSMLTCYDYSMALALDKTGLDMVLVGDSLGNVIYGFKNTTSVTMNMMIEHTAAVRRGTPGKHLIADMPYGSHDNPDEGIKNAKRLMDAGADSLKMERPSFDFLSALNKEGIPFVGHVGLTPQTDHDYRRKGKDPQAREEILSAAVVLERAGAFSIVVEAVVDELAEKITRTIKCPTIGIAAGQKTDGQVLVLYDMLGVDGLERGYVRQYLGLHQEIISAVEMYVADIGRDKD